MTQRSTQLTAFAAAAFVAIGGFAYAQTTDSTQTTPTDPTLQQQPLPQQSTPGTMSSDPALNNSTTTDSTMLDARADRN